MKKLSDNDTMIMVIMKENDKYIIKEKDQVGHGFMDLVIYKEDEIIIIDFKHLRVLLILSARILSVC